MTDYYDLNHARQRLSGSVVQLDDKFVHISNVDKAPKGNFLINYFNLSDPQQNNHVGYIPKQKVSTKNFLLGYVNFGRMNNAVFCKRMPSRMWKEGLQHNNVVTQEPRSTTYLSLGHTSRIIISPEFDDMLNNRYPEYDEAKKKLKDTPCVAFSRQFAIDSEENLIFRNKVVGVCRKVPELKNKYSYLSELLEQEIH